MYRHLVINAWLAVLAGLLMAAVDIYELNIERLSAAETIPLLVVAELSLGIGIGTFWCLRNRIKTSDKMWRASDE